MLVLYCILVASCAARFALLFFILAKYFLNNILCISGSQQQWYRCRCSLWAEMPLRQTWWENAEECTHGRGMHDAHLRVCASLCLSCSCLTRTLCTFSRLWCAKIPREEWATALNALLSFSCRRKSWSWSALWSWWSYWCRLWEAGWACRKRQSTVPPTNFQLQPCYKLYKLSSYANHAQANSSARGKADPALPNFFLWRFQTLPSASKNMEGETQHSAFTSTSEPT